MAGPFLTDVSFNDDRVPISNKEKWTGYFSDAFNGRPRFLSVDSNPKAAASYQPVLTTHGITTSMSRRGNCWDNACVESFFGTLKRELVYHRHYATRDIFEYIEVFYHRQRRHSTLGYDSPAEYEARTAVA